LYVFVFCPLLDVSERSGVSSILKKETTEMRSRKKAEQSGQLQPYAETLDRL